MARVIIKLPKISVETRYIEPVLIDIDKLVAHEEIVPGRLRDLMEKIKREGIVDMPIIVAPIPGTDKYLIVDGHHRWAALKELGYRKAPAIIVDYFDEGIKLETWYPAFKGRLEDFIVEAGKSGLKLEECSIRDPGGAVELADTGRYAFVLIGRSGECLLILGGIQEQKKVSEILSKLNMEEKITLYYYGVREEAIKDLEKGEIDYLLLRKPPTKKEVIETVKQGKVYSPKTTRHILPYKPAFTNTPLEKLK